MIAADGPDVSRVDGFRLRDSDGVVLEFVVGVLDVSSGGLPAPHLREHLVSGEPITVTYETRPADGERVAIRYVDAE